MAKLAHEGARVYTTKDVISVAEAVIDGNAQAVAEGRLSEDTAIAMKAGILTILLMLGIDVEFDDGTQWHMVQEGDTIDTTATVVAQQTAELPPIAQPPKAGRENLN